jgi:hypothetical protein
LIAHFLNEGDFDLNYEMDLEEAVQLFLRLAKRYEKNDFAFNVDVLDKRTKYIKGDNKVIEKHYEREQLGLPSNLPVYEIYRKRKEAEEWKNTLRRMNLVRE